MGAYGVLALLCFVCVVLIGPSVCEETDKFYQDDVSQINTAEKCECPWQNFQHYSTLGCQPVFDDGACCPKSFKCDNIPPDNTDGCYFRGKVYAVGDEIKTNSSCDKCRCTKIGDTPPVINCAIVECPHFFRGPPKKGCTHVYDDEHCCPVGEKCEDTAGETCMYMNDLFRYGQKIYPLHDPCKVCLCNAEYDGSNGKTCKKIECNIDKKLYMLKKGCIPIYHETGCCPIEYHCPQEEAAEKEAPVEGKCQYNGKNFDVGSDLDINHPTGCVSCSCSKPPMFTCIHRKCPGPPDNDWVKCRPIFTKGDCCAKFDCSTQTKSPERLISSFPAIQCATPKCADGCMVETDVPFGSCPGCVCDQDKVMNKTFCSPPKCPRVGGCKIVKNEGRCESCNCEDPIEEGTKCSTRCPRDCMVETNVPEGECPGCLCTATPRARIGQSCGPMKCPRSGNCRIETNYPPGKCPACICKDPSGEDKCSTEGSVCTPSCQLESNVPEGQCPGCTCSSDMPAMAKEPITQIYCSPPMCQEGCEVQTDVPPGKCPGCVCKEDFLSKPQCGIPMCADGCEIDFTTKPCPSCKCQEDTMMSRTPGMESRLCAAPACPRIAGCRIADDGIAGKCPACICENPITREMECKTEMCPPLCMLETGLPEGQCPGCVCAAPKAKARPTKPADMCSPPMCPKTGNCKIEDYGGAPGKCPGCVCQNLATGEKECKGGRCPPGCVLETGIPEDQCPGCICRAPRGRPTQQAADAGTCAPPACPRSGGCRIMDLDTPGKCPTCQCLNPATQELECRTRSCAPGCILETGLQEGQCPGCVCRTPRGRPPIYDKVQCYIPRCDQPGCQIDFDAQPCPSCKCNESVSERRSMCVPPQCPRSAGCQIVDEATPGKCPSCVCENPATRVKECMTSQCPPGCALETNLSERQCPGCLCKTPRARPPPIPQIMCSMPKCEDGCTIDYTTKPCPSCKCAGSNIENINLRPQCGIPRCQVGCTIDYSAQPCPSCTCVEDNVNLRPQCGIPRCSGGCVLDYSTKPCPSCNCKSVEESFKPQCGIPRCTDGCTIDYSAKPCPSCRCPMVDHMQRPQCSMPRCEPHCTLDYTTKPCPSCQCNEPKVQCGIPVCNSTCFLDYSTQPCPSCNCEKVILAKAMSGPPLMTPGKGVKCPFVVQSCQPGCEIDYTHQPCPACKCEKAPTIGVMTPGKGVACPFPIQKCDAGCELDTTTRPCPVCKCPIVSDFGVKCPFLPKCSSGCELDYTNKPCPVCKCEKLMIDVMTPGKGVKCPFPVQSCEAGCELDNTAEPCPVCKCPIIADIGVKCPFLPKCSPGCELDFKNDPCPTCKCPVFADRAVNCPFMPSCSPGCEMDYTNKPCPVCKCAPECGIPLCMEGCVVDYSAKPCPACRCVDNMRMAPPCAIPKCGDGCSVDYSTKPCPSCKCDNKLNVQCTLPVCFSPCRIDGTVPGECPKCVCPANEQRPQVICGNPKCEPGCTIKPDQSSGCPVCDCIGTAIIPQIACSPPKCDAPCRLKTDVAPGQCPSCECDQGPNSIQCSTPVCNQGCSLNYNSPTGCPTCDCSSPDTQRLCTPPKCDYPCQISHPSRVGDCPYCICPMPTASQKSRAAFMQSPQPLKRPLCSVPVCDSHCHLEMNVPEGECPRCRCPDMQNRPVCGTPVCGRGCTLDYGTETGCPKCVCAISTNQPEIQCSTPVCNAPCNLQTNVPTGECPRCVCPENPNNPQCGRPVCERGCTLDYTTSSGCPRCVCATNQQPSRPEIECSTPVCSNPCTLVTNVRPGECPYCDCGTRPQVPGVQCSMPNCPPGCPLNYNTYSGCPTCDCDRNPYSGIQCYPPTCNAPCRLKTDVAPGQCPFCDCPEQQVRSRRDPAVQCSIPRCDPGCIITYGSEGECPKCRCLGRPPRQCSQTKCREPCKLETDIVSGQCPGCICPSPRGGRPQCGNPVCEAGCSFHIDTPNGCPACDCGQTQLRQRPRPPKRQCSPPLCRPPCRIQTNVQPGECPGCDCPSVDPVRPPNPYLDRPVCSIPNCPPGCPLNYNTPTGCPACNCNNTNRPNIPSIQCYPPTCNYPCRLETNVRPGECPYCNCPSRTKRAPQYGGIQCGIPFCRGQCRIRYPSRGCPYCDCGSSGRRGRFRG